MGARSNSIQGTEMVDVTSTMAARVLQDEEVRWMLEEGASTGILWGDGCEDGEAMMDVSLERTSCSSDEGLFDEQDNSQRTTTKTKSARSIHRIVFVAAFLFGTTTSVLGIMLAGAHFEQREFNRAPSTVALYDNDQRVCAMDQHNQMNPSFLTFNSVESAHDMDTDVAHCGACGHCSNQHDIDIQARTAATLTTDSRSCATNIFWGGTRAVERCMDDAIGFTEPCRDCWTENIQCTYRHCKFTCLKSMYLLGDKDTNEQDGSLSPCLQCDEKMCGPAFLECSGSNRRRLGIISDIERDSGHEQCKSLDMDWNIFA